VAAARSWRKRAALLILRAFSVRRLDWLLLVLLPLVFPAAIRYVAVGDHSL